MFSLYCSLVGACCCICCILCYHVLVVVSPPDWCCWSLLQFWERAVDFTEATDSRFPPWSWNITYYKEASHIFFTLIPAKMIQFDYSNIFQLGWNHQLVFLSPSFFLACEKKLSIFMTEVGWVTPRRLAKSGAPEVCCCFFWWFIAKENKRHTRIIDCLDCTRYTFFVLKMPPQTFSIIV